MTFHIPESLQQIVEQRTFLKYYCDIPGSVEAIKIVHAAPSREKSKYHYI